MKKIVSVKLEGSLLNELEKICEKLGVTKSEFLRKVIEEKIKGMPKVVRDEVVYDEESDKILHFGVLENGDRKLLGEYTIREAMNLVNQFLNCIAKRKVPIAGRRSVR